MTDPASDWLVRGPECGRTNTAKVSVVIKLMRANGPRCCGRAMTWYLRADPLPLW
jgi:hypothetical protein